jgi:hypothetical protein
VLKTADPVAGSTTMTFALWGMAALYVLGLAVILMVW